MERKDARDAALVLIGEWVNELRKWGFQQYRVDELTHPKELDSIRINYTSDEWRITWTTPGGGSPTVYRIDLRLPLDVHWQLNPILERWAVWRSHRRYLNPTP